MIGAALTVPGFHAELPAGRKPFIFYPEYWRKSFYKY